MVYSTHDMTRTRAQASAGCRRLSAVRQERHLPVTADRHLLGRWLDAMGHGLTRTQIRVRRYGSIRGAPMQRRERRTQPDPNAQFLGEQSQGGTGNSAGSELALYRFVRWLLVTRRRSRR